jgi:2-pyrone-4,6-dicarboxylate lactonase
MPDIHRVCYPPVPNPTKPSFVLPPNTCDTHFHVFGPTDLFPFAPERSYTPSVAPLAHYLNLAEHLGITRGVVTQPMGHGYDNSVSLDAVARSDGRFRAVIKADDRFDDAALKTFGVDIPTFDRVIARIAKLGWSVTFHALPDELMQTAEWIRKVPIPVVIDHFGRVDVALGVEQEAFQVYLDLVKEKHVWAKIACPDRLTRAGYPYDDVMPFVKATVEAAPDRLIWGTDWPHTQRWELGSMCDDGELVDLVPVMVPDETVRNRMLVDGPAALFDF